MTTLTVTARRPSILSSINKRTLPQTLPQSVQSLRQNASDEELLSAISLGAEWALEMLYQRYSRYAYALAYRILHDGNSAEDIVQESFLAIWRRATSYQRQQGSVLSWLHAIVHHRAIDKVRASAHREQQWTPLAEEGMQDIPSPQRDVWEQAWHKEQSTMIRELLQQLPLEQRQVIELAYFEGYTHAEIAQQKNIPLGTVKGRMRLGLQKMKHLLSERGLDSAL